MDTMNTPISELLLEINLKLADENGITAFTNAEIFEGMANLGNADKTKVNHKKSIVDHNPTMHRLPLPLKLAMTPHPDQELETETELQGSSSDFVHTPPTQVETSSPKLKSISPEPMEHTYDQPQPSPVQQQASPEPQPSSPPKSPPLKGPTSTYVEATRINVTDLLHLVPQLVTRIDHLEKEMKEHKQTTVAIIVKLVKKVKKLETRVKYGNLPSRKMVLSDSESEDAANSSKEGRNLGEEDVAEPLVQVASQRLRLILGEIREEEASLAEIARIQAQEAAKIDKKKSCDLKIRLHWFAKRLNDEFEMSEQQRKRATEVQQQAQYYTEEDYELIRARMEANT
ncbi:hypothetical protein Tco_0569028 [Tanacetum coccineum]